MRYPAHVLAGTNTTPSVLTKPEAGKLSNWLAGIYFFIWSLETEMKDTDPAFPCEASFNHFRGISRREYFAIKAMQSLLTHHEYLTASSEHISSHAFELADAMIKESDK